MEISESRKDTIILGVERAVLWGESRDDVFQMMAYNGITGEEADAIYAAALAERIAILRGKGVRTLLAGFVWLAAAGIMYVLLRAGSIRLSRGTFGVCVIGALYGLWQSGDGLARIIFARSATGSVTDED